MLIDELRRFIALTLYTVAMWFHTEEVVTISRKVTAITLTEELLRGQREAEAAARAADERTRDERGYREPTPKEGGMPYSGPSHDTRWDEGR